MKNINVLMFLSGLVALVATGLWVFTFYSDPLSHQTSNWSDFGSYIGGVIGPVLSFISIILVLQTIKQTQKNHTEQIRLIRNEHIYSKFTDLSNYLEDTIKKSWISDAPLTGSIMGSIQGRIVTHRMFQENNQSEAQRNAIRLEAIHSVMEEHYFNNIDEIVIILRSLSKFIFDSMSDDKELMSNMIETKIPKHQRFIIFYLMNLTHPADARELNEKWPTFWNPALNEEVISAR